MSGPDFERALSDHQFSVHQSPRPIFADNPTRLTQAIWGCTCGWVGSDEPMAPGEVPGGIHRAHLSAALHAEVARWLADEGAREAVANGLRGMVANGMRLYDFPEIATAALAALTTTEQEDDR